MLKTPDKPPDDYDDPGPFLKGLELTCSSANAPVFSGGPPLNVSAELKV